MVYAVIYDTYSSCAASGCAIVSLEFKLAPSLSCLIGTVQETSAYVKYRGNKLPTVFWWARKKTTCTQTGFARFDGDCPTIPTATELIAEEEKKTKFTGKASHRNEPFTVMITGMEKGTRYWVYSAARGNGGTLGSVTRNCGFTTLGTATCDVTDCGKCPIASLCDECNNNMYLAADKASCVAACPDATFPTGDGETGRTCTACETAITDCNECTEAGKCDECQNSKFLAVDKTSCGEACQAGEKTNDSDGATTGRTCAVDCDFSAIANCNKCTVAGTCSECTNSKFLAVDKASCPASCPAGTKEVGSGVTGRTCVACDVTDCGQCSEAGKCDECQNSKFLAADTTTCPTECPVGTYSDDNGGSATGRKCMPCSAIEWCGKCSVAGLCDECGSNKFLDLPTKTCLWKCSDTQPPSYGDDNGGAVTGRTCKACDVAHCGKCSKSGECDICKDGKFLAVNKKACLDPCPDGTSAGGFSAAACKAHRTDAMRATMQKSGNALFQQRSWDIGCDHASYAGESGILYTPAQRVGYCQGLCANNGFGPNIQGCCNVPDPEREPGKSLCYSNSCSGGGCCAASENVCTLACQVAFFTCAACDITDCGKCSAAGKCDECKNSKFLAVDTTTCPAACPVGTYSDDNGGVATGRKCMPCGAIADCGKCSVAGLCDECANSKFLDVPTKTCSTTCPDGSYGDDNGGAVTGRTCKACDVAHCGKCSKSGECDECNNSKFLAEAKAKAFTLGESNQDCSDVCGSAQCQDISTNYPTSPWLSLVNTAAGIVSVAESFGMNCKGGVASYGGSGLAYLQVCY